MRTRSDHRREFVEGSSTAQTVGSGVDAELVVTAAKVLDERANKITSGGNLKPANPDDTWPDGATRQ